MRVVLLLLLASSFLWEPVASGIGTVYKNVPLSPRTTAQPMPNLRGRPDFSEHRRAAQMQRVRDMMAVTIPPQDESGPSQRRLISQPEQPLAETDSNYSPVRRRDISADQRAAISAAHRRGLDTASGPGAGAEYQESDRPSTSSGLKPPKDEYRRDKSASPRSSRRDPGPGREVSSNAPHRDEYRRHRSVAPRTMPAGQNVPINNRSRAAADRSLRPNEYNRHRSATPRGRVAQPFLPKD